MKKKTLLDKVRVMKSEIKDLEFYRRENKKEINSLQKENRTLEVEKTKLESLVAFKDVEKEKNDLQKDLNHSNEKHKLKDEIISLLKDRPKEVKVEVQRPVYGSHSVLDNTTGYVGSTTGTSITTTGTANGSAGFYTR